MNNCRIIFLSMVFNYLLMQGVLAQNKFCPRVLILEVDEVNFPDSLKKDIDLLDSIYLLNQMVIKVDSNSISEIPENFKVWIEKMKNYKISNYRNMISLMAFNHLTFVLERMPKTYEYLVYPINKKTVQSLDSLKMIAIEEDVEYILGFPKMEIYYQELKYVKMNIMLYSLKDNAIILDTIITENQNGEWRRFGCKVGTIDCAINSILYQISWSKLIKLITY